MTCDIHRWLIGTYSVGLNFGLFSFAAIVVGPVGLLAQETARVIESSPEFTGKVVEAEDTQACQVEGKIQTQIGWGSGQYQASDRCKVVWKSSRILELLTPQHPSSWTPGCRRGMKIG